jgi:two-component system cell cycle sensor histidine kinase/response regulator CckA
MIAVFLSESISQDLKLVHMTDYKMGAVFRNVVTNAVEAMPDGGTLKIKAENLRVEGGNRDSCFPLKPGDYVHISIQDQGKVFLKNIWTKSLTPISLSKKRGVQKGWVWD